MTITDLDVEIVLREFIQWELDQLPATKPEPFLSPLLNEYTERMTCAR